MPSYLEVFHDKMMTNKLEDVLSQDKIKNEMENNKSLIDTKIQALKIKQGDRIIAYFKNRMQICTVKSISNSDQTNITLLVFPGKHYRYLSSGTIRFKPEALVDLVN